MRIAQVSAYDGAGGAARVASNLHRAYRASGAESWLVAGRREGTEEGVIAAPPRGPLSALRGRLCRVLGLEDFEYPWSRRLLELLPSRPDVLQCHNLHGDFFDLRALAALGREVPLVLTLHDAWLLSGHCAHSLGCGRWETGCGDCPDLGLYPPVRRDLTAFNWRRKSRLFAGCRVRVAAPSQRLLAMVRRSLLAPAVVEERLIPNGVDLSVFRPGDRNEARRVLNLPLDADILLFSAHGIRANMWKDARTLKEAAARASERRKPRRLVLLAAGEDAPVERVGEAEVRYLPTLPPEALARCYQAADLYVHAARAETFPNVVLEALACGAPVVASSVGGIPEQVSAETGLLVPAGDAAAMADAVVALLEDAPRRAALGAAGAADAVRRFGLAAQAAAYLTWFGSFPRG